MFKTHSPIIQHPPHCDSLKRYFIVCVGHSPGKTSTARAIHRRLTPRGSNLSLSLGTSAHQYPYLDNPTTSAYWDPAADDALVRLMRMVRYHQLITLDVKSDHETAVRRLIESADFFLSLDARQIQGGLVALSEDFQHLILQLRKDSALYWEPQIKIPAPTLPAAIAAELRTRGLGLADALGNAALTLSESHQTALEQWAQTLTTTIMESFSPTPLPVAKAV